MMQIPNLIDLLFHTQGILILKIPILILIALYVLFLFIVISRLRAFDRIIQIPAQNASGLLRLLAFVQLILALSLFFLTLIIV